MRKDLNPRRPSDNKFKALAMKLDAASTVARAPKSIEQAS